MFIKYEDDDTNYEKELIKREHELCDVLYIFFDKNEFGIKLTYKSNGELDQVNEKGEEIMLVDASRMEFVEWNDEFNIPNRSVDQLYRDTDGIQKQRLRTIIVSSDEMTEILNSIKNSHDLSNVILRIDSKGQRIDGSFKSDNKVVDNEYKPDDSNAFFDSDYSDSGIKNK